jgi:hypothetical protein
MRLTPLAGRVAVCRLDADAPLPAWPRGDFVSITRTPDELSVVCDDDAVPDGVRAERGWRALRVEGPIPFEVTGVAAALTAPLARDGISLFLVSTFDTDYLLVKAEVFARAIAALRSSGLEVYEP